MNNQLTFWIVWIIGSVISYLSMRTYIRSRYIYKTSDRVKNLTCCILFSWVYLFAIFILWINNNDGGKEAKW
jgi:hypothetical protein